MPFASEKLSDIFGVSPQQVVDDATPLFEVVYPEDLPSLYQSIENSKKALKEWEYEFRIIRASKEIRWIGGLASPEKLDDGSIVWHGYILDITERKYVEQENLETRVKYQSYFENATDGLFVVNRQGFYTEANPAACQMTGFSLHELLRMNVRELIAPEFDEPVKKTLERSFEQGSVDEEVLLKKKNGEILWVRLVTSKIDENTVIAFCHDITQRKYHEGMLQAQLGFQKLMASISSGFVNATSYAFDDAVNSALAKCGEFFDCDRSYVFLFSDDHQKMTNTHEWCAHGVEPQIQNFSSFETENVPWWWEQIKNKKVINLEEISEQSDLTPFEVELFSGQDIKSLLSVPMISNGQLIGFLGLDRVKNTKGWNEQEVAQFNLVTEAFASAFARKKAEGLLRDSENRYRLLAENALDVIFRLTLFPKKGYEYVSPSAFNLTGYTPEEYYEDPELELKIVHPDDAGKINYDTAPKSYFEKPLVIRLICKDGKIKWCEQSNVPIFDNKGKLTAIEGIARDITDQKQFEEKLRELNVQLLQKQADLENLNASLEKRIAFEVEKSRGLDQIMALQARQAAIGEMMANVAHQWRQPLNVLSLAIYDLADAFNYDELDKKYMDNAVGEMNRIIQEMSKTIDDFRSFYKSEKEKKSFRVASIIKNALVFMNPYFDKANIIVGKNVLPEVMVYGYASQLEQVLINILKNALDALENFEKGKREVFIKTYYAKENYCAIEVINTGEPVAREYLPRLFDPYFSTKPEGQGLGLGLYVAKTIVEMNMKGKINCENTTDGVKFSIELPCSQVNNEP